VQRLLARLEQAGAVELLVRVAMPVRIVAHAVAVVVGMGVGMSAVHGSAFRASHDMNNRE
jgi:hypothetical protein